MDRISQRLQSLVKTFSEIHQYSHDVHWITCRDFKYAEYISPSFEEIWGCSPRDILEDCRAWDSHVLPIDLKNHHPFLEMIKRIKEVGPSAQYNEIYRIVRPDGCIKWILDRGHPLYDENGEYIGVTGVATDVTWLKHHDALLLHSSFEFPQDSLRLKYYLGGKYKNIYLTQCEAKCALYLLRGKTSKQIAKVFNISPRTVEGNIAKIKFKLNIKYRADLCEALIESDFVDVLLCGA